MFRRTFLGAFGTVPAWLTPAQAAASASTPHSAKRHGQDDTVAPAVFVTAGVVAVTRAQERGYALVSIG